MAPIRGNLAPILPHTRSKAQVWKCRPLLLCFVEEVLCQVSLCQVSLFVVLCQVSPKVDLLELPTTLWGGLLQVSAVGNRNNPVYQGSTAPLPLGGGRMGRAGWDSGRPGLLMGRIEGQIATGEASPKLAKTKNPSSAPVKCPIVLSSNENVSSFNTNFLVQTSIIVTRKITALVGISPPQ
eukprot:CAMPEP_0198228240 /NCGR_PEP_ID=MMETSP1445-20131203/112470_1 /TAXON_ID=36898 /ORGANISM="Pyramimonas sp., Strain CCMP2087" /LENGTH=180 /DNA_ID=CAMNT_0043908549 /DNA_START=447 /DNA_END=990 /DNA_ORIENTATION=-